MSGAYSIFPLRLVVVFNLTTTNSRNAFQSFCYGYCKCSIWTLALSVTLWR